jgi:hypothetical protein
MKMDHTSVLNLVHAADELHRLVGQRLEALEKLYDEQEGQIPDDERLELRAAVEAYETHRRQWNEG